MEWRVLAQRATPGIPGADAVHGHNNVRGATLFPHNIGLGATRDTDLVRDIGRATARAVRATGLQWTFAPTLAVVQDVRWGRTYESFSVDPAIVRSLGRAEVEGLQEGMKDGRGVLATAKHFVADGGTLRGVDQGVSHTTLTELAQIHGAGHLVALDAGVLSVMVSFSSWTDSASYVEHGKMHGNATLLTEVLKKRLAFDGFVVSDWEGVGQVPGCISEDCPAAINSGIDIIMVPFRWKVFIEYTVREVEQGRIPMARIDDAVRRILRVKFSLGMTPQAPATVEAMQAPELARRAVRESLVLLKNKPGLLPLPRTVSPSRATVGAWIGRTATRRMPTSRKARRCWPRCVNAWELPTSCSMLTARSRPRRASTPSLRCWPRRRMPRMQATFASTKTCVAVAAARLIWPCCGASPAAARRSSRCCNPADRSM